MEKKKKRIIIRSFLLGSKIVLLYKDKIVMTIDVKVENILELFKLKLEESPSMRTSQILMLVITEYTGVKFVKPGFKYKKNTIHDSIFFKEGFKIKSKKGNFKEVIEQQKRNKDLKRKDVYEMYTSEERKRKFFEDALRKKNIPKGYY